MIDSCIREPNTEYILSLSYGKDSLACLGAIEELGYPLDRIVHAEVYATDDIPADLPSMVEFKKHADGIIKSRYGIEVEHIYATTGGAKLSYERQFYSRFSSGKNSGRIYGFPFTIGAWCNDRLKVDALSKFGQAHLREMQVVQSVKDEVFSEGSLAQGATKNIVQYLGIASDEPERIARHAVKENIIMPLVDIGWDEKYCRDWCEKNNLLSPIYTTSTRGGCWFCHNQGVSQLRELRKSYPELWRILLKWDLDSPTTFKPNGRTVADFEARFQAEDAGIIKPDDKNFKWKQVISNTQ